MWFSSLSKYTWIKLGLLLLFTVINVVLYTQSSHAFLGAILPQLGISRPVNLTSDVNVTTATNNSFSPLTDKLNLHLSTATNNSFSPLTDKLNLHLSTVTNNRFSPVTDTLKPNFSTVTNNIFDLVTETLYLNFSTVTNRFSPMTDKLKLKSSTYGVTGLTTRAYETHKIKPKKTFFDEKLVNPHDFPYVFQPNVSCNDVDIELVICVPISHDNYQGRKVIRDTWGSYAYNASNKAILVFFLGSKLASPNKPQTDNQVHVSEESSQYGDIVQEDFVDSYKNLSLKSVSILKWVSSFCYNAKFVLKADDDMYINIPFLVKTLREYGSDKSFPSASIIGAVQDNAQPIRNPSSKWYTPISLFKERSYPKYVSGTAYSMTTEAAYLLYEASLRLPTFWLEDVYITGLCARKAAVHIYNNGYFTYGKPSVSGCSFLRHISGHRYNHQEIISIHKQLYDSNIKC